jgi:hypothetical protein
VGNSAITFISEAQGLQLRKLDKFLLWMQIPMATPPDSSGNCTVSARGSVGDLNVSGRFILVFSAGRSTRQITLSGVQVSLAQ